MRDMFTKKPDEGCREVEAGIFARPVQTSEEGKMLRLGWSYSIDSQRGNDNGIRKDEEEGREEEVEVNWPKGDTVRFPKYNPDRKTVIEEDRDNCIEAYKEKFGKPPHHKMKTETIRKKLDESDD